MVGSALRTGDSTQIKDCVKSWQTSNNHHINRHEPRSFYNTNVYHQNVRSLKGKLNLLSNFLYPELTCGNTPQVSGPFQSPSSALTRLCGPFQGPAQHGELTNGPFQGPTLVTLTNHKTAYFDQSQDSFFWPMTDDTQPYSIPHTHIVCLTEHRLKDQEMNLASIEHYKLSAKFCRPSIEMEAHAYLYTNP